MTIVAVVWRFTLLTQLRNTRFRDWLIVNRCVIASVSMLQARHRLPVLKQTKSSSLESRVEAGVDGDSVFTLRYNNKVNAGSVTITDRFTDPCCFRWHNDARFRYQNRQEAVCDAACRHRKQNGSKLFSTGCDEGPIRLRFVASSD